MAEQRIIIYVILH